MKAVKVYNNNAVSVINEDGKDAIYVGSGIGFRKKPGDEIDVRKAEKIYFIQDELQTKFLQLLKDTRPVALTAAEEILKLARKQGMELKDQMILSLTDHISFALDRYEQGIDLPYLVLAETKLLYRKEYEIGKWGLDKIEQLSGIRLAESEAGYIALQLASSSLNREITYKTLKLVKGALDIIKNTYNLDLDEDNIDTLRLTTHLKFLAQRIFNHVQWQDEDMDVIYQSLLIRHPRNVTCMKRISDYIKEDFYYELNDQEKTYLLIHLNKIILK